jgi:serine/threonine protein kinase
MAEKQYSGPPADVWSLGIVLYAMVVGQLPWKLDERGIICDVEDLIKARFTIPTSATMTPECEDLIRRILVSDPLSRIKLEDVARHPWILKGFGYPVDFNGEVYFFFPLHFSFHFFISFVHLFQFNPTTC